VIFYFQNKTKYKFKPELFKKTAALVFKKLKFTDKIELGLKITNNDEIKKLNQKYLKINLATDVLSFSIDLPDKKTKREKLMLGDIVISVDKAKEYSRKACLERSRENKKTVKAELIQLFKHGLLHLLGYDHEKNKKEWQGMKLKIDNC
jgi:probable rRNA maturation factor